MNNIEETIQVLRTLIVDMENLKNAYPYSNDNECYNRAIEMCKVLLINKAYNLRIESNKIDSGNSNTQPQ